VKLWLSIALGILLAFVIASIIAYLVPSADDLSPENPLWNGLTKLVSYTNATVITYPNVNRLSASSSTLFIIGLARNLSSSEIENLKAFVENGGALVLASEKRELNSVLKGLGLGVVVNGSLVADRLFFYKSPLFPQARASIAQHNLTLYLNYASHLSAYGKGKCMAYTSPFSFEDLNMNGARDSEELYGPFCIAYAEPVGKGVVYVVSDSSIFINSMIDLGSNKLFATLLTQGRRVYIAYEQDAKTLYTAFRSSVMGFYRTAFGSELRYFTAIVIGIAVYKALKVLLKGAVTKH
jgi:hypothetical protein